MYTDEFPMCCGIKVINGFGHDGFPGRTNYDIKTIEAYISTKAKGYGLQLIALNDKQIPVIEHVLLKHGFEILVKEFYHPAHYSRITLYGRKSYSEEEVLAKKKEQELLLERIRKQNEEWERQARESASLTSKPMVSSTPQSTYTLSAYSTANAPMNATYDPILRRYSTITT